MEVNLKCASTPKCNCRSVTREVPFSFSANDYRSDLLSLQIELVFFHNCQPCKFTKRTKSRSLCTLYVACHHLSKRFYKPNYALSDTCAPSLPSVDLHTFFSCKQFHNCGGTQRTESSSLAELCWLFRVNGSIKVDLYLSLEKLGMTKYIEGIDLVS